jgi:hypothetical protein
VSFFRYDGNVRDPVGLAIPGANVAVLTDPSSFTTQPGSPLAAIYVAAASNSASVAAAFWLGQQITFTFSTTPPADVLPGSYISVSGVTPSGYNSTLPLPWLVLSVTGSNVVVLATNNPGPYVSGGTVATSVLPNPTSTDGNGNYFFYAVAGQYGVQIYGPTVEEQDLSDQGVGSAGGGGGGGGVSSVALTAPAEIGVSGSPITSSGTIALSWTSEPGHSFFAGPSSGSSGTPAFRSLALSDLPAGIGTVTSVGLTLSVPSILSGSVSGSPVTSAGTLGATIGLVTQNTATVWAGPTSGGSAAPTFRLLVPTDIPRSGQIASGAADAILFPAWDQNVFVVTGSVDAMTLATPIAGTDDFKTVRVVITTAFAHTITTAANRIVPSHSLITFGAVVGLFIQLIAYGGFWYPQFNSGGITIS